MKIKDPFLLFLQNIQYSLQINKYICIHKYIYIFFSRTNRNFLITFDKICIYSPFHKTLPKSSLKMHRISLRFYEIGDIKSMSNKFISTEQSPPPLPDYKISYKRVLKVSTHNAPHKPIFNNFKLRAHLCNGSTLFKN